MKLKTLTVLCVMAALVTPLYGTVFFQDNFDGTTLDPAWTQTWATGRGYLQDGKFALPGNYAVGISTEAICSTVAATDMVVNVDCSGIPASNGGLNAGIYLRFQDNGNYVIAMYNAGWSPGYLYFQKAVNGSYQGDIARVACPNLGPNTHMVASFIGTKATAMVTDGTLTYQTSTNVYNSSLQQPGSPGLENGEGLQLFDNFVVTDAPSGTNTVTGTVLDAASQAPLVGAKVAVVGTSLSATTDSAGSYSIQNVPSGMQTLDARLFGYRHVQTAISLPGGSTEVTAPAVELKAIGLDWAQCAYATASKNSSTAINVNDGDPDSGWRPDAVASGDWLQLAWDQSLTVSTILVDCSTTGDAGLDFTVQSSADGTNWSDVQGVSGVETGHNHWLQLITPTSPVQLKYLRLMVNSDDTTVGEFWSVECYTTRGSVTGFVKDSADEAIANANVYVYEWLDGQRGASRLPIKGVTGSDGSYSIPTPAGPINVTAAAADSLSVTSSSSVTVMPNVAASVPDLVIAARAGGSPAFADDFNSVGYGEADPALDIQSGSMVGQDGALLAVPDTTNIATAKDTVAMNVVADVDLNGERGGLVTRYVDEENYLLFIYNMATWPILKTSIFAGEVYGGSWAGGSDVSVPIDETTGHLHLVVVGNQVQGFVSDDWNTYWIEPFTVMHNLGPGRVGLYGVTSGSLWNDNTSVMPDDFAGQLFDNFVLSATSASSIPFASIETAKAGGVGWAGYVKGVLIGVFPESNRFVIESEDRTSGLSVLCSQTESLDMDLGGEVIVYGSMGDDGQLSTGDSTAYVVATGRNVDLAPFGMTNKNTAATAVGGSGPSNENMLVRTWGRVLSAPSGLADGSKTFYITDGTASDSGPTVPVPGDLTLLFRDSFSSPTLDPLWVVEPVSNPDPPADLVTIKNGKMDIYGDWTNGLVVSVCVDPSAANAADVAVSVDASTNSSSAALILRYRDNQNYLRILYNSAWGDTGGAGSVYFNEYADGITGSDNLDRTLIPALGSRYNMSATFVDDVCTFTLSDGTNSYTVVHALTSTGQSLLQPGTVGVQGSVGDQLYDNFRAVTWSPDAEQLADTVQVIVPPGTNVTLPAQDDYVTVTGVAGEGVTAGSGSIRGVTLRKPSDLTTE